MSLVPLTARWTSHKKALSCARLPPLPYRDLKTGGKGDDRALFLPAAKWSGLQFTIRGGFTHLVLNVRGTAAGLWGRRPLLVKGPDRLGAMRKRTRCGGNRALQIALLAQRKMTNHAHPSQRHLETAEIGADKKLSGGAVCTTNIVIADMEREGEA